MVRVLYLVQKSVNSKPWLSKDLVNYGVYVATPVLKSAAYNISIDMHTAPIPISGKETADLPDVAVRIRQQLLELDYDVTAYSCTTGYGGGATADHSSISRRVIISLWKTSETSAKSIHVRKIDAQLGSTVYRRVKGSSKYCFLRLQM